MTSSIARKKVYCDWNFLNHFVQPTPDSAILDDDSALTSWTAVRKFIQSKNISLIINLSTSEYREKMGDNKILNNLWKKTAAGEANVDFLKDGFPVLAAAGDKVKDLSAIYLTCADNDVCEQLSKEYGVFVLNTKTIMESDILFKDNGDAINGHDREDKTWEHLLKKVMGNPGVNVCNSLVLVDNYAFHDSETITKYILPIFEMVIPQQLASGVTFDVSLFFECKDTTVPAIKNILEQYKVVNNWLHTNRPSLKFNFAAYKSSSFHDRAVVTNNAWIDAGKGLNLSSAKNSTSSVIFPYFISNTDDKWPKAYSLLLSDASACANGKSLTNERDYWCDSTRENRLIGVSNQKLESLQGKTMVGLKILGKINL